MIVEPRTIVVDDNHAVSSEWAIPRSYEGKCALLVAHGAGNDMHNPLLSYIHRSVAEGGRLCVKFNFPYKELGRRPPDPTRRLMSTWRAVIRAVVAEPELSPEYLFLSGKSLGGRMAAMVAAEDGGVEGLAFFGYPLHPARQTDKLRIAHFPDITCPMLFVQGTRDPLCDLDLLRRRVIQCYPDRSTLHVVEGGDHSFNVPKKMNRPHESIAAEIVTATERWIAAVLRSGDDGHVNSEN